VQEAVLVATKLDGLIVTTKNGVTKIRNEHFGMETPRFAKCLRTWGEAGGIKTKTRSSTKLDDEGTACLIIGHAEKNEGDCHRMWYPNKNSIHMTIDVMWLKRMHFTTSRKK